VQKFVYEHLFLCIPLSLGFALLHSRLWMRTVMIARLLKKEGEEGIGAQQ
jgi:hypothetical protein